MSTLPIADIIFFCRYVLNDDIMDSTKDRLEHGVDTHPLFHIQNALRPEHDYDQIVAWDRKYIQSGPNTVEVDRNTFRIVSISRVQH